MAAGCLLLNICVSRDKRPTSTLEIVESMAQFNNMRIWISWENHQRSRQLAKAFGGEFIYLGCQFPYLVRALFLSIRTLRILATRRPGILFVQNPSILLATQACLLRPFFGYTLVVDRHSNFKFETTFSRAAKYKIFQALSRFTVRRADLTIVTNDYLRGIVEEWDGRGVVLLDRIPDLRAGMMVRPKNDGPSAVFVAGYGEDEPLAEVLRAAALVHPEFTLYVTGDFRKHGVVPPRIRQ